MGKSLFVISLIIAGLHSQAQQFKNLVFEGAGIRGIAYAGVLKELEESAVLPNIERIGGTSAGATTALMVSLGYTSQEVIEIISGTKFKKFNDGQYMFIGGFSRLNAKYGWYKGDALNDWLATLIEEKTGNPEITFAELASEGYRELYVTATCLNKQRLIVFSAETYPHMSVKDAVRISMSIPLYFEAVFIDSVGTVYKENDPELNLDVVVDGGIIGNYPISLFDSHATDSLNNNIRIPNDDTLGVRIDSDSQIQSDSISRELVPLPISNMSDYLEAFYVLILENLNRTPLIPEDWERTISVSSVGISPRIKKLSQEQKDALVKSGETSARAYLKKE